MNDVSPFGSIKVTSLSKVLTMKDQGKLFRGETKLRHSRSWLVYTYIGFSQDRLEIILMSEDGEIERMNEKSFGAHFEILPFKRF